MTTDLTEFTVCPNCGSTKYLENYPTSGTSTCTECMHEITKVTLSKTLPKKELSKQNCPYCGRKYDEDDNLFYDGDVTVFKCQGCGKLKGYKIVFGYEYKYAGNEEFDESAFSGKAVAIAKKEGRYILNTLSASKCAEIAKAIRRMEEDPKEKMQKTIQSISSGEISGNTKGRD